MTARKVKYTPEQLDEAARLDLFADAASAEWQAKHGPHYPERGITHDSLMAYAAECRAKAGSATPHADALRMPQVTR